MAAGVDTEVCIVGAGLAGLIAATELAREGVATVVVDKSRAVGGRMSSRTVGPDRFDQGAQHIGTRDAAFGRELAGWVEAGVAREWFRTRGRSGRIEPRFVGVGGMRSIPEHLAAGLGVRTGVTVGAVKRSPGGIVAEIDGGATIAARGVILTPPLPQLLALVDAGGLALPTGLRSRLAAVSYDACLAVMAELDGPSGLPDGHASFDEGPVAWLGDNQDKGTSATSTLTIHSSADFAAEHLEADPDEWTPRLCAAAAAHLEATIVAARGHRWRYAEPQTTFDDGAVAVPGDAPVVLAGEVFAGAKVEGAFLSGRAAAELVLAGY